MKAIMYERYGSHDVAQLREIGKPTPKDDEVLVKVHTASVNPADWLTLTGTPYLIRLTTGLRSPRKKILGKDSSGVVEAVGKDVRSLKPGDEVFGENDGAFSEYLCAPEKRLAKKPATVSFEGAASVPIAGITALQGLRANGPIQPGQKVLINGASGGVGTFAVQIAKSMQAEVTGVCSGRNLEMVRSIGADHVIDYSTDDFTLNEDRYDLIFDLIGNRSLSDCRRVLNPKGALVLSSAGESKWFGPMWKILRATALSMFISQKLKPLVASQSKEELEELGELLASGLITPVIRRRYSLEDTPEALRKQGEGHAQGKSVIAI